jgi:hypothetical protein
MTQKRIYIVCPVRNVQEQDKKNIEDYVRMQEAEGNMVYYPARDTLQNDGIVSVLTNDRAGMHSSDEVHVYWTMYSRGSIFDLGMAYMSKKQIFLANRDSVKPTKEKSFENFLLELDDYYRNRR